MSANNEDVEFKKPKTCFGVRHFQVLLLFLGITTIFFMKVDMTIAIVAMTDSTQNNTFSWSLKTQSVILSSYKWGYLVSKIPGGELSARFGGKIVMVTCGFVNCVASLVLPIAGIYGGWQVVCFCRLAQGLAQGVLLPTLHTLTAKWAPPDERSRIASILSSGGQLGTALEYILAGLVAAAFGWQAIFYVNGIILLTWTIIYLLLGASSPQESKSISEEEKLYILNSLGQGQRPKRVKTPWKAILTSIPFLTLMITHVGAGWGYWTLLTEMPTYLNKVLGVNIKTNGLLSALPYIASCLTCLLFGWLCDFLINRNVFSINAVRKISNSFGTCGPAILLICLSYVTSDVTAAVALLTASVGLFGAFFTGCNLAYIDLAPNHAGTLLGVSGFVSNIFSTFAPLAVGFLVHDETSPAEWRKIFISTAGIMIVSNMIFIFFGTTKTQKWNYADEEETTSPSDSSVHNTKQSEKVV